MTKKWMLILLLASAGLLVWAARQSKVVRPVVAAPVDAAPTWVNYGNRLALNTARTWAYYTVDRSGDDASNCIDDPQIYRYGRVNAAQVGTLESGCDIPQAGAIAADSDHLYYTYAPFGAPATAYRQPATGGEPEQVISIGTVEHAVVLDDTYAYFAMHDPSTGGMAIVKVDKATLLLEIVAQLPTVVGDRISKMTADDTYIYWTEGSAADEGAVRAVAKTGGTVFTAAEAGTERPQDIVVDGDYVYWAEAGGRIRRILKSGGAVQTLYDSNDPVFSIFIKDTTLYFSKGSENGTIWRMNKDGGAATLMAFDRHAPHALVVIGSRLYWAESSIYYIDSSTTAVGVDYALYKLEVTQGIQDGANSMPLVSNKATYVRAYPHEVVGTSQKLVNAYLYGYGADGRPLPGSPLSPLQKADPQPTGAPRSDVDHSFVFLLPEAWTAADFQLQAEINPDDGSRVFETDYTDNLYPADAPVPFSVNPRVACMIALPVIAQDEEGGAVIPNLFANGTLFYDNLERTETLLPATLRVYPYPMIMLSNENYEAYDLTQKSERGYLMSKLATYSLISDVTPFSYLAEQCDPEGTAVAGLVHPDAATTDTSGGSSFTFGGQGNPFTQSMWSILWFETDHQPFNQPRGAVTMAHEMGHVFGRDHVDCNNPDDPDPNYPYDPCLLGDSNDDDAFWGFDGLSMMAIDPMDDTPGVGAGDLMSYRTNRWPSDYTWLAIYDAIGAANQGMMMLNAPAAMTGDVIMVRGMIDATAVTGSLQPIYQ
ncbi:MAG: DUF5050 domain-containing protein, partial [Anaerolineales bacterium]|nr:DUF5050 domain-containing protein [Anaerolineales bacterium]